MSALFEEVGEGGGGGGVCKSLDAGLFYLASECVNPSFLSWRPDFHLMSGMSRSYHPIDIPYTALYSRAFFHEQGACVGEA